MSDYLPFILFGLVLVFLLAGFPVAFTIGGLSVLFGIIIYDVDFFYLLSLRIYGIMNNFVLLAVPLFIFMGIMLEKSGLAESLLETMALLFGKFKGGLAISVVVVGAMLAASTGIVGATVVTMGLISLPIMLKRGYSPELATGTIAASGTLGQIVPPSVVLVLLGSVLNISVGNLFKAALLPSLILIGLYLIYLIVYAKLRPAKAPIMPMEEIKKFRREGFTFQMVGTFILPMLLIILVLGSIFAGVASPTEAAGIGAFGALVITLIYKRTDLVILKKVMKETTQLTSMVFMILIGATAFSLVFRATGGDRMMTEIIESSQLGPYGFLFLVMITVFILGFFIDFIEITFIIVPVVTPIFISLGIDLIWVGILLAINLQTSFLTPPFGFSLFYLKGVAPPGVSTRQIYAGIIPFVIIQLIFLGFLILFPEILYVF
ncbi:MAG TPA: TRAP transporter large permease subunit [Cyclobacteriaceae bacterium]